MLATGYLYKPETLPADLLSIVSQKNKSQLQKDGQFKMLFGYPTDEDKYPSVIVGD